MEPAKAKKLMAKLSEGCMAGRTMYVIPYMMGHPESPYAKACLMVTDSSYVAISMRVMTRIGTPILEKLRNREDFIKGFHSIGTLDPNRRYIMHFPEEGLVWSVGSRSGSAPSSATSRAGWPSTWSSWASRTSAERSLTSRPPCPAPAARRTWP
jgi:phosphoenolpyruvate carboxykinase (GTP)